MTDHPASLASEPRPRTEVWAAIRADYLAGDSAAVVAERHGLSERSIHRRAAAEGWRRRDAPSLGQPPVWSRPVPKEALIANHPELGDIDAAHAHETFELLFDPGPQNLRRFAFRKAAEQAAMNAPQQALVWLRLTHLLDRCGDRISQDDEVFQPVDHLRAAFLRRLEEDYPQTGSVSEGDQPP